MSHHRIEELRKKLAELRTFNAPAVITASDLETRDDGSQEFVLEGYAAVFDSATVIDYGWCRFEEVVARGAFRKLLATNPDVVLQFDHDGQPMARTTNATLKLEEDARGLKFRAVCAATTLSRDVHTLVKRGDLKGCSFTFAVDEDGDRWEDPTQPAAEGDWGRRYLLDIARMRDVSVVTSPAYDNTSVQARTAPDASGELEPPVPVDSVDDADEPAADPDAEAAAEQRAAQVADDLQRRMRAITLATPRAL